MKLPAHLRVSLKCYVRSDLISANAAVDVGGIQDTTFIDEARVNTLTTAACAAINSVLGVADVRPMTAAEVFTYLDDERRASARVEPARKRSGRKTSRAMKA